MSEPISISFNDYSNTSTHNVIQETKAIVTFKEDFPFNELSKLLEIVLTASPEAQQILVLSALNVANKMKKRFQNSLSDQYELWVFNIESAIKKLINISNLQCDPLES